MAINRRFLYAGLFLVTLGGVLVAVDLSAVETSALSNALPLWPLAIVAIGAGLALRRSRYALIAGTLGALIPGLVLGGGLVVAPRHGLDCAATNEAAGTTTQQGEFAGSAVVQVDTSCGSISIGTSEGRSWQLTSSNTTGRGPHIDASPHQLQISSSAGSWLDNGRDTWSLTLPTAKVGSVVVTVKAGRATATLPDANIGTLSLTGNGADIVVDASTATVEELDGAIDFGRLAIQLPERGAYSGAIHIGAGQLLLCVPFGVGARIDFAGSPREVRVGGLRTDASSWENDLHLSARSQARISVKVNFGSVAINPIGGCK